MEGGTNCGTHRLTRMEGLFESLGISEKYRTQETLDWMYFSYSMFVYNTCGLGITCNILCIVVLMRKSMRSSTTCILLGLAIYDSLYLMTCFATVEEFKLLGSINRERSAVNGHFAYPINKTGQIQLWVVLRKVHISDNELIE